MLHKLYSLIIIPKKNLKPKFNILKININIYKSKDLVMESMRLSHVAHFLKFSLFSLFFLEEDNILTIH